MAVYDNHIVGNIVYAKAKVLDKKNEHDVITFGPISVLRQKALENVKGRFFEGEAYKIDKSNLAIFEKDFPYKEKLRFSSVAVSKLKFCNSLIRYANIQRIGLQNRDFCLTKKVCAIILEKAGK